MKLTEKQKKLLKQVCDHFDQEDRAVRERQIRTWKKLKYYWNGFQRVWWSEVAHDWRIADFESSSQSNDAAAYDKPINIFRAYLESIIAALSVTVPPIKCFPDDAENNLDLETAKAGDRIAKLVFKHNDAPLLWVHALFIFCTEGMIAAYNYAKEDKSYGTVEEKQYKDEEREIDVPYCGVCGSKLGPNADEQQDEYAPDDEDMNLQNLVQNENKLLCPNCLAQVEPQIVKEKILVTKLTGVTSKPKTRQCIEVYGGLFVKVANYAQRQSDTPYLIWAYETHYSNVLERYPELKDNIGGNLGKITSGGMYDPYERWGRLSTQYAGEYPLNTVTVRNCWLRPSSFHVLPNEDDVDDLKKLFPNGAKVVLVNDQFADSENEALDDSWTLTYNPLSDYLQHDPLGLLLVSVQDITNDLNNLVLQTIEHGIPQTFADPVTLNFDQYRQTEATPGMIFPAKTPTGKSLGESFYEVRTASLSAEVQPFATRINEAAQLVSGALPSLFGGAQSSGGKTAAQYSMSRAQALQRLQTPWKVLTYWWKNIFSKVIPSYIKTVVDDERFVEKSPNGNFINTFIRRAELQGKIGSVELEANENLPINWTQQREVMMQLLQGSNPEVMDALTSPENIPLISRALGLDEFVIPGESDRQKQYEEIRILLESEPTVIPIQSPQGTMQQEVPSVDIEPLVDHHPIHIEIAKSFLVSSEGRLLKIENPTGYRNILLHLQRHVQYMQAMAQPNQEKPKQQKPMLAQVKKNVGTQS